MQTASTEVQTFKPSPQQAAFLEWVRTGRGSCVLEAVAGAGKSTTLLRAVDLIQGQTALLAYNKKIAEELKEKLKQAGHDWKRAQAGTVHSFGFSAYRKAFPDVKVDEDKCSKIWDALHPAPFAGQPHKLADFRGAILTLVSLAKQSGIGFLLRENDASVWEHLIDHHDINSEENEGDFPEYEVIASARAVLRRSAEIRDVIDFDDMIYMPLLLRVRFWQFDVVMVDEAQDTNATRRALVRALVKRGGRVIAVGDRHQAIYGFTGADSDALDLIAADHNAVRLPLTVTYRCPKSVVAHAQQWVGHIEAASTAPMGIVRSEHIDTMLERKDLTGRDAILCRNTKPLVALALQLVRRGVGCRVEGRDIAEGLVKLAQRWKFTSTLQLEKKLEQYLEKQKTALLAKGLEQRFATLEDTVETLRVVIESCRADGRHSINDVVERLRSMFDDNQSGVLTLSTIHRSKGREWQRVFWLDRQGTCPSPYARQKWQQEQEKNLMYVAATRAQNELVEVIV